MRAILACKKKRCPPSATIFVPPAISIWVTLNQDLATETNNGIAQVEKYKRQSVGKVLYMVVQVLAERPIYKRKGVGPTMNW